MLQTPRRGKKTGLDDNYPPLKVRLTDFDRKDHLKNVVSS